MKNRGMPSSTCIKKYIQIDTIIYYDVYTIIMNIYDIIYSDNVLLLNQIMKSHWFDIQNYRYMYNHYNHNIAELAITLHSYKCLECIVNNYIYMRINSIVVPSSCPLHIIKKIYHRMSNLDVFYIKAEKYASLDVLIFLYFNGSTYTPYELNTLLKKINRFEGSIYDIS